MGGDKISALIEDAESSQSSRVNDLNRFLQKAIEIYEQLHKSNGPISQSIFQIINQ